MNWTKFKETYLFSINFNIMLAVILYAFRKDFRWHPVVLGWLVLALAVPKLRKFQKTLLVLVGKVNSVILLTLFYYLFFTPFSVIYKLAFRNSAFKKLPSQLKEKSAISSLDQPF